MTICNIVGTIADSGGTALSGRLDVTLVNLMESDLTTPDTIYLPFTKSFIISSGVVNISLRESETSQVAYRFQFFLETAPATYSLTPILDFYAIVPNGATYEFAKLVPTGITSDTLATGARRVAKEIFADPGLTTQLGSSIGIIRQDAKPSSGQAGQIWIRPTSGQLWRWSPTLNEWISAPFQAVFATVEGGISANTNYRDFFASSDLISRILIESVRYQWVVQSPVNASNFWTIPLARYAITSGTAVVLDTLIADSNPGTAQSLSRNLNIQINPANTAQLLRISPTRTGAPGNLILQANCTYSWIHS